MQFHLLEAESDHRSGKHCQSGGRHLFAQGTYANPSIHVTLILLVSSVRLDKQGSRDNMSIIIIAFPGAPKPTEEAIEAERRLEKHIEKIARGCLNRLLCL